VNITPELRWLTGPLVSALHAAEAMTSGKTLVDVRLVEALAEPVENLAREIVCAKLPVEKFWSHLLPLSQGSGSTRQLAETALAKTVGRNINTDSVAGRIGTQLAVLDAAMRRVLPKLGEELALRAGPLREQWEARGPGFLHSVYRLTDPSLAVPTADVLLVQPVLGGGGAAHLLYNSVRIEAVLANPVPELPETVRLGWLLSQLNLELPSLGEKVLANRLARTAELAMLPVALKAGEEVELCRFDRPSVARAVETWRVAAPPNIDLVPTLFDWWDTYLESRPGWPVALGALDRMLHSNQDACVITPVADAASVGPIPSDST
jgi:hypothetical protein